MSVKKERQMRYLSQAIQLEEAVNPHIIRATMLAVSLAILTFIGWAGMTNINEVARTAGEVVPHGYQQTVQHLEGGIVKDIAVNEGETVRQGDILLRLDGTGVINDLNRARSKQIALEMQEERLRAYIEGREADFSRFDDQEQVADQQASFTSMRQARDKERQIIRNQLSQKQRALHALQNEAQTARQDLEITQNLYNRRARLNAQGYAPTVELLENERQLNEIKGRIKSIEDKIAITLNEIGEYKARLESSQASYLDLAHENLNQVLADKTQNAELIRKLADRSARLDVRAPADGMVKGLAVNTVGAVVQPGQTLMEIVPLDKKLEVAVKIPPQHIGHVKPGQNVQIKFSTFDFSRYGAVSGTLESISATTFTGENGERYYRGMITLSRTYVGKDHHNLVIPGMTVMADIVTGEKTILEYLFKPVHLSFKTAFMER